MEMKPPSTYLTITSVVFGTLAVLGIMPALFSPMKFDAPGSQENPATQLLFWTTLTFPLVCAFAIATSWGLFALHAYQSARLIALVPILNSLAWILALVWLEVAYDGKFNGHL